MRLINDKPSKELMRRRVRYQALRESERARRKARRKCPLSQKVLTWDERRAAKALKAELQASRLTVELVPSRRYQEAVRGVKIRVVVEENAPWYKRFCAEYPSSGRKRPRTKREVDTSIRRRDTLIALGEMILGCCRSLYAQRLLPYVRKRAHADRVPF